MKVFRALVLLSAFISYEAKAGETFAFDMPEPRLRIVIPDVPQMKMNVPSDTDQQFAGSDGTGYTVSVLTLTADGGLTPRECARSSARGVINRFSLDPKYVVALEANGTTFVMLFPYRVDPVIQFKAFLFSGYRDTHCVEVHVSRAMQPAPEKALAEDLARWFEGFRGARIEPY